jgi:uncharacterized membrane protein required for colicin V production
MNIIDLIILAILAFSVVSGMHKGFVTSTLALLGFCASWVLAYASYGYLVTAVQQNESMIGFLNGLVSAADLFKTRQLADLEVAAATAADIDLALGEVGIPLISDLFRSNVLGQVFANEGLVTMSEYLTQTLLISVLNIVAFILAFAVIYMAVLLFVNMLNNVFRFPMLRHFDWLLGGAFGLVRGAVIVLLIFSVVPTVCSALESMDISLLTDIINESTIGKMISQYNPITNALNSLIK